MQMESPDLVVLDGHTAIARPDSRGLEPLVEPIRKGRTAWILLADTPGIAEAGRHALSSEMPGEALDGATLVMTLHRAAYYDPGADLSDAELNIRWNDLGPRGLISLRWDATISRFSDR